MSTGQTEWSLQKQLTEGWLERRVVGLDEEPLFLAAWEVMTSYRINDARRQWNEPSIDFLFLDRLGRMVLLELKREVRTPREAWSVLCQVTHRAHVLAARYEPDLLDSAYRTCRSGLDGRVKGSSFVSDLVGAHAHAFGQAPLKALPGVPVRRLVMANTFADSFSRVLQSFNNDPAPEVAATLRRYAPRGEISRYLGLLEPDPVLVATSPIRALTPDGIAWSPGSSD